MKQTLKVIPLILSLVLAACGEDGGGVWDAGVGGGGVRDAGGGKVRDAGGGEVQDAGGGEVRDAGGGEEETNNLSFKTISPQGTADQCVAITIQGRFGLHNNQGVVDVTITSDAQGDFGIYNTENCYSGAQQINHTYLNGLGGATISATFWVKGAQAQTLHLTASSDLGSATLTLTIVPGKASRLVGKNVPTSPKAGQCQPLTVARVDSKANLVETGVTAVQFTSESGSTFHADAGCATAPITQATIVDHSNSVTVYFRSTRAATQKIDATALSLENTYTYWVLYVTAGPATKLLISLQDNLRAAECAPMEVSLVDDYNNVAQSAQAEMPFSLASSAGEAVKFFSDASCQRPTSTSTLLAGTSSTRLYIKGLGGDAVGVTVSTPPPLKGTSRKVTVAPAVRRGACVLESNYVACPVSPPVSDRSKAFFLFQATSDSKAPSDFAVRCYLADNSTVACSRKASSSTSRVNLSWQVVELATGLYVQHLNRYCDDSFTSLGISFVDPSQSFVLFSSEQEGTQAGSSSFATALLATPWQVVVTNGSTGCAAGAVYSVQVVMWGGLLVNRDTLKTSGEATWDVSVSSAPTARSLVLSTHQAAEPSAPNSADIICNRVLRGEVVDDTTLRFTRGAGSPCDPGLVTQVAWQRLTFDASSSLQSTVVTVNDGATQATGDLGAAMDPQRTLLLSSSQVLGGQGGGETAYWAAGIPGVASARFDLKGTNTLQVTRDTDQGDSRWTVYALQLAP